MTLLLFLFSISLLYIRRNAFHVGDCGFGMAAGMAFLTLTTFAGARFNCFPSSCVIPIACSAYIFFQILFSKQGFHFRVFLQQVRRYWRSFAFAVVIFVFLWYLMVYRELLPRGTDAVTHALLAEKILRTGALCKDWLPFDPGKVVYPQGIHAVIAAIATMLKCSIPKAEQILQFSFLLPTSLLIGALAMRFFASRMAGWYAALTFVLLGNIGTFYDYWVWGGYPAMMGAFSVPALFWYVFHPNPRLREHIAAICIWGAMGVIHYSSFMITAVMIIPWGAALIWKKEAIRKKAFQRFLTTFLLSNIINLILIPFSLDKNHGLGDIFHQTDDSMTPPLFVFVKLGVFMIILSALGVQYALMKDAQQKNVSRRVQMSFYLLYFITGMFMFLMTDYVIRYFASYTGEDFTWFVPLRFLATCTLPMTILSGGGLVLLQKKLKNKTYVLYILHVGLLTVGVVRFWVQFPHKQLNDDVIRLAKEIRNVTPENAFLLYDSYNLPDPLWTPVLAWRACLIPPLPSSEDRSYFRENYRLFTAQDIEPELRLKKIRRFLKSRDLEPWVIRIEEDGRANAIPLVSLMPENDSSDSDK